MGIKHLQWMNLWFQGSDSLIATKGRSFRGKVTINPHEVCSKECAVSSNNLGGCWPEFTGHAHMTWSVFIVYSDSRDQWGLLLSSCSVKNWILNWLYTQTQGLGKGTAVPWDLRLGPEYTEAAQANVESLKIWGSTWWQAQRQMWQTAKIQKTNVVAKTI